MMCQKSGGVVRCSFCLEGYYDDSAAVDPTNCQKCDEGCLSCYKNNEVVECGICKEGYYDDSAAEDPTDCQ